MMHDCGSIYSAKLHECGRRAVLWTRVTTRPKYSRADLWKCGCGAELPASWSGKQRGRRRGGTEKR